MPIKMSEIYPEIYLTRIKAEPAYEVEVFRIDLEMSWG